MSVRAGGDESGLWPPTTQRARPDCPIPVCLFTLSLPTTHPGLGQGDGQQEDDHEGEQGETHGGRGGVGVGRERGGCRVGRRGRRGERRRVRDARRGQLFLTQRAPVALLALAPPAVAGPARPPRPRPPVFGLAWSFSEPSRGRVGAGGALRVRPGGPACARSAFLRCPRPHAFWPQLHRLRPPAAGLSAASAPAPTPHVGLPGPIVGRWVTKAGVGAAPGPGRRPPKKGVTPIKVRTRSRLQSLSPLLAFGCGCELRAFFFFCFTPGPGLPLPGWRLGKRCSLAPIPLAPIRRARPLPQGIPIFFFYHPSPLSSPLARRRQRALALPARIAAGRVAE